MVAARLVFSRKEGSAKRRGHAQQCMKIRRNTRRRHTKGFSAAGQVDWVRAKRGNLLKEPIVTPELEIVPIGEAGAEPEKRLAPHVGNQKQPLRFEKWQRAQQYAVHDRENRRVCPYAEAEC